MTDPTAVIVETLEVVLIESTEVGLQGPPGVDGVTDHGALTGLSDDDHSIYHTDARGDARYAVIAHAHTGTYEPADATLLKQSDVDDTPVDGVTTAPISSNWAYDHAALTTAHGISTFGASLVDDTDAGTARTTLGLGTAATTAATDYAVAAKGVTNGDSHDHNGGDGAQISYANLSNLPTLGTAAATAATDYATASHNHTGTYLPVGVDAADLTSGAATDNYVLTADGAGGAAWEAAAVTYAGAASEIHAAADKATPVDADELGLVDSAASWVLKKLTWANLKTTLAGVFPLLAGKTGGQTIVGGTGVTDKLLIKGTSGNGTVTAVAFEVDVGNNGALTALTVANNGQLTIQGDATTDLPVYGAELLTSAGWTVNTGWTESPDDTFAHTSGTDTLTHSATITSGHKYQISWTVTGRTAGSFTVAVGGQSVASQTATSSFGPTATATTAFTITPTTDFNGTLSLVSLKRITAVSTPKRVTKNSAGTIVCEERLVNNNVSVGINTGGFITTGDNNNCFGYQTGQAITTGSRNNCFGYQAGYTITAGTDNNCFGYQAGYRITTGASNNCFGYTAGYSLTTGIHNNCYGYSAGYFISTGTHNNCFGFLAGYFTSTGIHNTYFGSYAAYALTTGSYNNAIGYYAGRYHADGATALTDPEYSVYIGANARGKDNADSNSVVIGGNTPIGLGANTTVIGTSATTLTRLYGNVATGVDAPSAAFHAIKTTEQLRLGYDASNYASFTVDSAGNLTLATTGTSPSVYIATLRSGFKVTPVTTTASPAATDAGTVFTNEADADGATITLPTAAAGLNFIAYVQTAQTLTITASAGDTIRIASNVTAAAGSITSNVVGSSVTLVAINATEWVATASIGSWSF